MIKAIRTIVVVLFTASVIAFSGSTFYSSIAKDELGPEITVSQDNILISVNDSSERLFDFITAIDEEDGDVHELLAIESIGNFSSDMTREATIAAFDTKGNVKKTTITFGYSDYSKPRVSLTAPFSCSVSNISKVMDEISVSDCLDGDISPKLQLISETSIDTTTSGLYKVHIQVSNSAGDSIDYPITFDTYLNSEHNGLPVIELTDYLVYVKEGTYFNPKAYLQAISLLKDSYVWDADENAFLYKEEAYVSGDNSSEEENRIEFSELTIKNPVNTRDPGVYEVSYAFSEYNNGAVSSVRLIVIVEE